MNQRFENIIDELVDQYAYADTSNRPWIIGFSGGKDSTVLLTFVWLALQKIKKSSDIPFQLKRPVYVICNDTMVENPIIEFYVNNVLAKIEDSARNEGLPIFVKKTIPKLENSFWVNVLGKGYPVPNNSFRWCTEKLKIKPTSDFITEQLDGNGEAIILIGTRYGESATRARSIQKHEIKGKRLTKHPLHNNTFVYSPIKELMLEEVWYVINTIPSPWGFDNKVLYNIYANASADDYECPTVVTDDKHRTCGQSRFGCWTCTVVKVDKSMSALINNGEDWLTPLYNYRNDLAKNRNINKNRSRYRRNGQLAVTEEGQHQGNYTPEYRAKALRELLEIQRDLQKIEDKLELITNQELIAIQVIWYRDGIFDFKVGEIFAKVYGRDIMVERQLDSKKLEDKVMQDVCKENEGDIKLIENLVSIQSSKTLMLSKYGIQNDIENTIEKFVIAKEKENENSRG
ncbi:DNA phosphorothioation system sulfurtransferase DndC [Saccharicrinis sp. 156]|uniref:DNA phosphorothioation system sulfurtransferase DndC n=1 Tax=Saccharicrinis sp. 156 TaxID=3417574 RepID=UPI003D33184B